MDKHKPTKREIKEYLDYIKGISNEQLLDEVIATSGGDDYDGCFTEIGRTQCSSSLNELKRRLKEIGFYE